LRIAAVTGDPRPLYTPVAFCEYHAENEDESRRRAEPLIAEHLEKRLAAGEFSPAQRGGSPGCQ
jgi:hypothetical protein